MFLYFSNFLFIKSDLYILDIGLLEEKTLCYEVNIYNFNFLTKIFKSNCK